LYQHLYLRQRRSFSGRSRSNDDEEATGHRCCLRINNRDRAFQVYGTQSSCIASSAHPGRHVDGDNSLGLSSQPAIDLFKGTRRRCRGSGQYGAVLQLVVKLIGGEVHSIAINLISELNQRRHNGDTEVADYLSRQIRGAIRYNSYNLGYLRVGFRLLVVPYREWPSVPISGTTLFASW
jgi:hypothetical protein